MTTCGGGAFQVRCPLLGASAVLVAEAVVATRLATMLMNWSVCPRRATAKPATANTCQARLG